MLQDLKQLYNDKRAVTYLGSNGETLVCWRIILKVNLEGVLYVTVVTAGGVLLRTCRYQKATEVRNSCSSCELVL
jgi:hypothetical protein